MAPSAKAPAIAKRKGIPGADAVSGSAVETLSGENRHGRNALRRSVQTWGAGEIEAHRGPVPWGDSHVQRSLV